MHYKFPESSWKFEVAPAGIGFMRVAALGTEYQSNRFMAARAPPPRWPLVRFKLTADRANIAVDDPRLSDRVAGRLQIRHHWKANALFGRNFGVSHRLQTGPNHNLFLVSLSNGLIYGIHRRQ